MPLNIVGVSAYFHDSACCLLQDGAVLAAAEQERFSRIKHDPSLPVDALRFCLEAAGITINEVDYLAYYENPTKKTARQLWMKLPELALDQETIRRIDPGRPMREIREVLGYEGPVLIFDHHLSHAASTFYFSGFEEAAILTVDGTGEWATTTYGHGSEADIEIYEEVRFPDSLGLLYSAITGYLGFEVNEGEYKVMGLAPYGEARYIQQMHQLLETLAEGQYRLNLRYFDFLKGSQMHSEELVSLFGQPVRLPEAEITGFHQDVARSLQAALEEILLEKAGYLSRRSGSQNLCMAGGVALNCVANRRLLRDGPFQQLFVQPAASDAGCALGAAAAAHVQITGARPSATQLQHVFWGPEFSNSEVSQVIEAAQFEASDFRGREDDLLREVAARLARGQVIGWFQGRMEFGPRSLGARSILADPRSPGMRDRINAAVKQRESFRPFAPAVLESRMSEHFDLDHASPFMLETCQVHSALELPAITHVDGSARVQTVSRTGPARFQRLLEEFECQTGCPMLLNTSFNQRGEPIVCTPADALLSFLSCDIDALVMQDFVVDRASVSMDTQALVKKLVRRAAPAVSHRVYTLV